MSAKELLFSQYSKDNIEKQNDIYAINYLIQGDPIDEEVPKQKAIEVQALRAYKPSQQKSQNIVIEPKKDADQHAGLAQFQILVEDKETKNTKDKREMGDANDTNNTKEREDTNDNNETKGPDFIERFYYASLTVVGLYVIFRMIQKTK
jgi:hypothetical protein